MVEIIEYSCANGSEPGRWGKGKLKKQVRGEITKVAEKGWGRMEKWADLSKIRTLHPSQYKERRQNIWAPLLAGREM